MDQYAIQSYFKSLCKSFYIAYEQLERLEREKDELEKTAPGDELEVIEQLLEMPDGDEYWKKYITQNYSKEELQQRKEKLELDKEEYDKKSSELSYQSRFWFERRRGIGDEISKAINQAHYCGFNIIVTSEEEIIAFIYFFHNHDVHEYRVIDAKNDGLQAIVSKKEDYKDFLEAYYTKNHEEINRISKKYF